MTEIYTVGHPPYKSAHLSTVSIHAIKSGKTLCGRRVNLSRWRIIGRNEKLNLVDCKVCLRKMFHNETFHQNVLTCNTSCGNIAEIK